MLALSVGAACSTADDGAPRAAVTTTPAVPTGAGAGAVLAGELPVPRTEVSGVAWQGRLAVAGGLTLDGGASALLHLWDPATGAWTAGPDLPRPLHHAALVTVGGRLYVIGGYTNGPGQDWVPQAGVASLGPGEAGWRSEPPLPSPRGALAAAEAGGLVVVMGGEAGGTPLATSVVYDAGARAWRDGPALRRAREHLAAASVGGRVFAVAGRAAEGNFTDVESLDPVVEDAWRAEPDLGRARGGIGAAAVGSALCAAGGEEPAGTIAPVECLRDGEWRPVADLARPRHGLAVMALDDRLHVVAGGEQPGLTVSGIHEVLDVPRK